MRMQPLTVDGLVYKFIYKPKVFKTGRKRHSILVQTPPTWRSHFAFGTSFA